MSVLSFALSHLHLNTTHITAQFGQFRYLVDEEWNENETYFMCLSDVCGIGAFS